MKKLLIVVLVLPFVTKAQTTDSIFIRSIANEMMVNGKAYDQLRYLTKKIGGRLTGSPQMVKAEAWGASMMKQSGADSVILQEVKVPHWVRGGKDKAAIISINGRKQSRSLNVVALGNSMGSGRKGVTAEVVAVSSFTELEAKKDEVKGKIVFYNYAFNAANIIPGLSYRDAGAYRSGGASRAARYGAVAVIVRSLTEATNNDPHTGAMRYNDSFPKVPAIAIGVHDADSLWAICKKNKSVTIGMTTYGYFLPDTTAHNIIGELRGTEFPEQIITFGGHLDSWDINEGAHDDGTGVTQAIEVLRTLKALNYHPKRTLRFVLFANEENGLKGGERYAEAAKEKNEQHVFAIESDGGGFTPRGFTFNMPVDKFEKVNAWSNLLKPYLGGDFRVGGGGADIGPLNKNFKTPLAGFEPDNQRYFDLHHAAGDIFEAVNKRELLLGAVNIAALIYLVDKYGL